MKMKMKIKIKNKKWKLGSLKSWMGKSKVEHFYSLSL